MNKMLYQQGTQRIEIIVRKDSSGQSGANETDTENVSSSGTENDTQKSGGLTSRQKRIIKTNGKIDENKSNDIVILHTNDVHCGVTDTIGYDGLMLYKKQLQKKYKNVKLVDAGDHIQVGTIGL